MVKLTTQIINTIHLTTYYYIFFNITTIINIFLKYMET